jgi:prephenate dehydrogenase
LIERISQIYSQNLDYYFSFTGQNKDYYQEEIQTALGMIKRMNSIASQNNQQQLAEKMDSLFNLKVKSYQ